MKNEWNKGLFGKLGDGGGVMWRVPDETKYGKKNAAAVTVFGLIAITILYFFGSNYFYRENRPTTLGIKKYLLCHGVWDVEVNVCHRWDDFGDAVSIYIFDSTNVDKWVGKIPSLSHYGRWGWDMDLKLLGQCRNLRSLDIGNGRFYNVDEFLKFPRLRDVRGYVNIPLEGKVAALIGDSWDLYIEATSTNIKEICQCDKSEYYNVRIDRSVLKSFDAETLNIFRAKRFKSLNYERTERFWANEGCVWLGVN